LLKTGDAESLLTGKGEREEEIKFGRGSGQYAA